MLCLILSKIICISLHCVGTPLWQVVYYDLCTFIVECKCLAFSSNCYSEFHNIYPFMKCAKMLAHGSIEHVPSVDSCSWNGYITEAAERAEWVWQNKIPSSDKTLKKNHTGKLGLMLELYIISFFTNVDM